VAELLEATLRESGYLDALAAERTIEAEGRAENLEELVGVAAEFDANHELEGEGEVSALEEFLQQIALVTQQDELRDEPAITLMTLHNAKGLEYETVFVVGCEDGSFPHMKALEEGGEEEERRLCYVAITRARSRLYMTWTRERRLFGRAERNLPSRFVDELPEELTERGSSAVGTGGWDVGTEGAAAPVDPGPALELRTGDDVVHASFGDGVVTAVEAGGVVVVRFAGDGSERKLMADYAPIRRR
jgi:DNA helicase-2/ATP-dependent DNA helicase PcrA